MMWLFVFFLWIMCAALFSWALGKAIHIADVEQAIELMDLQFQDGAR
jgi:hypothetical protein